MSSTRSRTTARGRWKMFLAKWRASRAPTSTCRSRSSSATARPHRACRYSRSTSRAATAACCCPTPTSSPAALTLMQERDTLDYAQKTCTAVFYGSTTGGLITADVVRRLSNPRLRGFAAFRNHPRVTFRLPTIVQCDSEATAAMLREMGAGDGRDGDLGGAVAAPLHHLGGRQWCDLGARGACAAEQQRAAEIQFAACAVLLFRVAAVAALRADRDGGGGGGRAAGRGGAARPVRAGRCRRAAIRRDVALHRRRAIATRRSCCACMRAASRRVVRRGRQRRRSV